MERKRIASAFWVKVGWVFVGLSLLGWAALLAVPFLPITPAQKGLTVTALLILAEALFWVGALFAGKSVLHGFRAKLLPARYRKK